MSGKLVRMSDELFTALAQDNERLTVEWGKPDDEGVYTPAVTRHTLPAVLLRDTPEDRERLAAIIDRVIFEAGGKMLVLSRDNADALIAALRERP